MKILKKNSEYFAQLIVVCLMTQYVLQKFHHLLNVPTSCLWPRANHKSNYIPVSILPLVSKIFVKIRNKQLLIYFKKIISHFQSGCRKGFTTQHGLFLVLEKWKNVVDNSKVFGALFIDLSQA